MIIQTRELSIVVIVPSYQNKEWYTKNLDSIFGQHYTHFRVIYIDDNSPDKTATSVRRYCKKNKWLDKITIIRNSERVGALANTYTMAHMCRDDELIVQLDGDDWFAHHHVLDHINKLYITRDIWLTYGQFQNWPTRYMGYCKAIPPEIIARNEFRLFGHVAGSIRSFYAGLFKKIKKKDLTDPLTKHFFMASGDAAYMYPMLEMAGARHQFMSEVTCRRNVVTPLNDFKIHRQEQNRVMSWLLEQKPYDRICSLSKKKSPT